VNSRLSEKGNEMSAELPPQVYVSYHDDDETWVEAELWPRLDKAGVTHIDRGNFLPQVPVLEEIQLSVSKCRYSLLIISPKYLSDTFSKFETIMLIQYGLDRNRVLTIPVVKDNGPQLPILLSFPIRVDVFAGAEWEELLIKAISQEPPAPADLADPAYLKARKAQEGQPKISAGFEALKDLMCINEVKEAVAAYHEDFEEASNQIQILADYKAMHDKLHDLETGCYRLLLLALSTFDSEQTRSDLISYEAIFRLKLEEIQDIASRRTFTEYQNDWLRNLTDALTSLSRAKEQGEAKALAKAVWNIKTVLGRVPSSINDRLMEAARRLRLASLVYAMLGVGEQLNRPELNPVHLGQFVSAINHLADFYYILETLKREHNRWQNVDNHLRRIQDNLKVSENDISELENSWPQLSDLAEEIFHGRAEVWATKLEAYAADVQDAILRGDIHAAKLGFQNFNSQANMQFIRVDTALLSVCEDLRLVGNSLASVVNFLHGLSDD
jgi:hypothetical protein